VRRRITAHPVLAVFLLALIVRAAAAVYVELRFGGSLLSDDRKYRRLALDFAAGRPNGWRNIVDNPSGDVEPLGFLLPLAGLYKVFGGAKAAGLAFEALIGAGAAAVLTRLALESLATRWALVSGLIVALLPSQVFFTSVVLKDGLIWLAVTALGLVVAVANRSRGRPLLLLGLAAVGLLVWIGSLRPQTLLIAAWALPIAMLLSLDSTWRQRAPRFAAAVLAAITIPWLAFGLGPAGVTRVETAPPPSDLRARNAQYAKTRIADTPYSRDAPHPKHLYHRTLSLGASDLEHLPSGISAVLLRPFPWEPAGGTALEFAQAEAVVWYAVLTLSIVGLVSLRRRDLSVMAFPLLVAAGSLLMYALSDGALGTAFRHRGELVAAFALLAGFGARRLLDRPASSRHGQD
jgi:hypothetical protein